MRSPLTWLAALVAVLFGGMGLQQWQLSHLRQQVLAQAAALSESQGRVADLTAQLTVSEAARARGAETKSLADSASGRLARDAAFWRKDERRLLLSNYSDFLAQTHVPPATLARLKDLLVERSEAIADAKDAAEQQGFASGSPEMAQATVMATADVDREIAGLLGPRAEFVPPPAPADEPNAGGSAAPVFVDEPPPASSPVYYAEAPASPAVPDYALPGAPEYLDGGYAVVPGVLFEGRAGDRRPAPPHYFAIPRAAGAPPRATHPAPSAPLRNRLAR